MWWGHSAAQAQHRVRGELLDDLLDARARDPRLLRDRAPGLHADLGATHVVLAARLDGPEGDDDQEAAASGRLWSAASHLAGTRYGSAAARDGSTVLLLPLGSGDTATDLARRTAAHLGAAVHEAVTVGTSGPFGIPAAAPDAVVAAYQEALRCLDALRFLGRCCDGAAAEDFGHLGLPLAGDRDIGGFVEQTSGPVAQYDEGRGTDLLHTLDAYFAGGMSPAHALEIQLALRLEGVGRFLGAD